MSDTTTVTAPSYEVRAPRGSLVRAAHDTAAVAQRNLIALWRVPQAIVFTAIQPVIFVLLWRYVFGGALVVPPQYSSYTQYLIPGIFVQTAVFGSMGAAIGLATDLKSGLLERFRSLPMARSAVLSGRTAADVVRNIFVVTLMAIVGFLVGFRIETNVLGFLAGIALLLAFGYSLSWIFASIGLWVADPETAQAAAFPFLAIFVFASAVFVPVQSMPSWLQGFATYQPVSVTASAVRGLMVGGPTAEWVIRSLIWIGLIIAVSAPLAVWRYRKTA
jgi:ABC-2 type transport system permease protein/oleandomycin transport system permease protein